jgi:hypothetical protein
MARHTDIDLLTLILVAKKGLSSSRIENWVSNVDLAHPLGSKFGNSEI